MARIQPHIIWSHTPFHTIHHTPEIRSTTYTFIDFCTNFNPQFCLLPHISLSSLHSTPSLFLFSIPTPNCHTSLPPHGSSSPWPYSSPPFFFFFLPSFPSLSSVPFYLFPPPTQASVLSSRTASPPTLLVQVSPAYASATCNATLPQPPATKTTHSASRSKPPDSNGRRSYAKLTLMAMAKRTARNLATLVVNGTLNSAMTKC